MRIMFIEPLIEYPVTMKESNVGLNIGLLSLASYIKSKVHDVKMMYFSQQLNKENGRAYDGKSEFKRFNPDVVAITSITANFPYAIDVAKMAKNAGAFIILGGPYPTLNSQTILSTHENIDIIVHGEGEITLVEILKSLDDKNSLRNINGITYRHNGHIFLNKALSPNLKKLPDPLYNLAPLKDFLRLNIPGSIQTARGCLFKCRFCIVKDICDGEYRTFPIQNIIRQLDTIESYGFSKALIVDDTYTINKKRTFRICNQIKKSDISLDLYCFTRVDFLDNQILEDMYMAGMREILIGAEVTDSNLLKSMNKVKNKPKTLTNWKLQIKEVLKHAGKLGYTTHPVFILGWPGETKKTLEELTRFIISINSFDGVVPFLSFTTPHPGSELWHKRKELGLKITTNDLTKYTHLFPVSLPESLGSNALELLINNYNNIAEETGSQKYNPILDLTDIENIIEST